MAAQSFQHLVDAREDVAQDFGGRLRGINAMHIFRPVKTQHRLGFLFVNFEAVPDDVEIGVVQPVFLQRPALQALHERAEVGAMQIKNRFYIQRAAEHFCLMNIAGDPVEHKDIALGAEAADVFAAFDELPPELYRRLVRDQLTAAGVLDENSGERIGGAQGAEDIAAGAMEETRNGTENFPLGALAGTGGAKEQYGLVFLHG